MQKTNTLKYLSRIFGLVLSLMLGYSSLQAQCEADFGTLTAPAICFKGDTAATIQTAKAANTVVPEGYVTAYVLTSGDGLVIENAAQFPFFEVASTGKYTIHTLVYDPATLDLGVINFGVTTGVDVNGLLVQGGGDICAALDVTGVPFSFEACEDPCFAGAGTLAPNDACLEDGSATLSATRTMAADVPAGYSVLYVLTSGDTLTIQQVGATPEFTVDMEGMYTIHTLVYDSTTLDLSIVVPGVTTGVDVNGLLQQGGGDICAALDVAGAQFMVAECACEAFAGTLTANDFDCLDEEVTVTTISASVDSMPNVPEGFTTLYVLTSGDTLAIQGVSPTPSFEVSMTGMYTIHTLVYDSTTLDLGIVVPGVTTGFDVNGLLEQGGGSICAALDVPGAVFMVEECVCEAFAGTLTANEFDCLEGDMATTTISATIDSMPNIPEGFTSIYVLTTGDTLTIQGVSAMPSFEVDAAGTYTIHTLVYDSTTLDLGIVVPGTTTGVDVLNLLEQGGGTICANLDVLGARFEVEVCEACLVEAGTLTADGEVCFTPADTAVTISASHDMMPMMQDGFLAIYVLTTGDDLTIIGTSNTPEFTITEMGDYTIHTLVYNPTTLDLTIVNPGVTTGVDVNGLLQQGGGEICGALDVAGAKFSVGMCPCDADAGTLAVDTQSCTDLTTGEATITASVVDAPVIPEGFSSIYVLTSGTDLVIEEVSDMPSFTVTGAGRYTIHTLVYDTATLDLGIVQIGVTTGVDVNGLLFQGGGAICAALDVAGAAFDVEDCPCEADAGTLLVESQDCIEDGGNGQINAIIENAPTIPAGFASIYVLTSGDGLVIEAVSATPSFEVAATGKYTIHTLVYDPATLDLGIVQFGVTTGVDVNNLLIQGGGEICGALDVAGASFEVETCPCAADVGEIVANPTICLNGQFPVPITAAVIDRPARPRGFRVLYVMTTGDDLVIQRVASEPRFLISEPGQYRIHTLVYNPNTLDLGIVQFGVTTGVDVNNLLIQGGGTICGALDVEGANFMVNNCAERTHSLPSRTSIFPNPSTNLVNVRFSPAAFTGDIKITIADIQGASAQTLQFDQGTTNAEIEVNTLPQGMYVMRIQYADKTEEILRFSKQ